MQSCRLAFLTDRRFPPVAPSVIALLAFEVFVDGATIGFSALAFSASLALWRGAEACLETRIDFSTAGNVA